MKYTYYWSWKILSRLLRKKRRPGRVQGTYLVVYKVPDCSGCTKMKNLFIDFPIFYFYLIVKKKCVRSWTSQLLDVEFCCLSLCL